MNRGNLISRVAQTMMDLNIIYQKNSPLSLRFDSRRSALSVSPDHRIRSDSM